MNQNADAAPTRESPKDILRELVRDEIKNCNRPKYLAAALALSLLGIAMSSASIVYNYLEPAQPSSSELTHANTAPSFHLEKIVGITTAFMVMADQKQGVIELSYALDIVNKRQAIQLGVPPQFTPRGDTHWLNRHMSLTYFHAAAAYLRSADLRQLEILKGSQVRHVTDTSTTPEGAEDSLMAQYTLIAVLQDSLDSSAKDDHNLYQEVRSLTQLWTDIQVPGVNQDSPEALINYQAQAERLLRNLNTDVRKP